jgi:SGNH domain (fused to AT3 domains)
VPSRRAAFALAGTGSVVLSVAGVIGMLSSGASSETDQAAVRLDAYNAYDYGPIYRAGSCFDLAGHIEESCLRLVAGKTNVLLWGDSFAAHYYHGLAATVDPQRVNILQATRPVCMPTFDAVGQGTAECRDFDARMQAFLRDHKPDLAILSADWLEYARPPRFAGMIDDLRVVIASLTAAGTRVVLIGPSVQFKSRLPSMLLRARLRGVEAKADDVVLPDIFALDAMMRSALPTNESFSYVSVLDAVCPARQCPVMLDGGVPLSFDHAHLTAEGSDYVMQRLAPRLGLTTR